MLAKLLGRREAEMGFLDHLEELRRVLLSCLAALAVTSLLAYFFSARILDYVVVSQVGEAQFLHPMEAFSVRIKISLLLGFVVSLPFIAFEVWGFVLPGLHERERRLVLPLAISSVVFFIVGLAFSYLVLTPMMMKLLVSFGTAHVKANIAVDYLIDFMLKTCLASGLLFELPLVIAVLTHLGIVTPRFLWSKWRHAVVIILVVAAVVTPGDGPSQLILAAPIVVLYFLSILLSAMIVRQKRRAEPPPPAPGETHP